MTATFDDSTNCQPLSFCFPRTFPAEITSAGETAGLVAGISQIKVKIPMDAIVGSMGLTIALMPAGGGNPSNQFARAYTVVWAK
jgi:hypothetical protein